MRSFLVCTISCASILASSVSLAGEIGPPKFFFSGCGEIIQGVECPLFASSAGTYILGDYGGFGIGDEIYVEGEVDPFCISFCQQGDGCIINTVVEPCKATADTFTGCGIFTPGPQSCTLFQADSGESFFVGDTGGAGFFQSVHVTGTIITASCLPPIPSAPGLTDIQVADCFSGCGELIQVGFCTAFLPDVGDIPLLLDDLGGFSVGDRVHVEGALNPECISICFLPCIDQAQVTACDEIVGDLDGDGDVDFGDLLILLSQWGPCLKFGPLGCPADLDGDNQIGFGDLLILLNNWTSGPED